MIVVLLDPLLIRFVLLDTEEEQLGRPFMLSKPLMVLLEILELFTFFVLSEFVHYLNI